MSKGTVSLKWIKNDGYVGILFDDIKKKLNDSFLKIDIWPKWDNVNNARKEEEIENIML